MASKPRLVDLHNLPQTAASLSAGDMVLLSGTVYTARDAAHKRFAALLDAGKPLPIPLQGTTIYYAGPTETPPGFVIGSCGPTTASRMDLYTPRLLSLGLAAMIGKGGLGQPVVDAMQAFGAVYFCALGGAGALAAKSIVSATEAAFADLGCESVKRLVFADFPAVVGIDASGNRIV